MVLFPSTYSIRFAVRNVERVPRHPILHRLPSSLIAGSVSVYCYCHASSFDAACYPSTKASSPCASAAACQRHSMPRQLLRVVDMFLPLLRLQFSFAGPPERAGCCFSVRFEHGLGPRAAKEGAIEALKTVDMRRFNSLDFKRLAVARRRGLPKSNMGKVFARFRERERLRACARGVGPLARLASQALGKRMPIQEARPSSAQSVRPERSVGAARRNHAGGLCAPSPRALRTMCSSSNLPFALSASAHHCLRISQYHRHCSWSTAYISFVGLCYHGNRSIGIIL